jgi:hypothetical protein
VARATAAPLRGTFRDRTFAGMNTFDAALRQLDRRSDDLTDRIMNAQATACTALEERLIVLIGERDEQDARTLAALAIARLIESTAPEDLLAFVSPFDPLLR